MVNFLFIMLHSDIGLKAILCQPLQGNLIQNQENFSIYNINFFARKFNLCRKKCKYHAENKGIILFHSTIEVILSNHKTVSFLIK